ncbi:MAG: hypothetical protein ACJ746_21490 [Bryobacteraceae bacterium]
MAKLRKNRDARAAFRTRFPLRPMEAGGMRARLFGTVGCLMLIARARVEGQEIEVGLVNRLAVPVNLLANAQYTAITIYARIGVKLKWSNANTAPIRIQLDAHTPHTIGPDAMGYALPYGDHDISIHILLDRISDHPDGDGHQYATAVLLGHVMAHELGHVLEGNCRHSETGVMKARWDQGLVHRMARQPLSFHPLDAALIRIGVARWQR